ncbi:hypothetical protein P154DRAFT_521128 [Amniculicola lignicola CBS 123094]|uniref:Uncharacterized protein n=1 Tax=Amniculicola lignicola CBS 123094 TaxID=1392246 RepID=A0A6A5WLD9_9PLEO|nr:hypothetical protein P154DRAFT_521128 [Amniculicola lignicola CBS 123094]
MAYRSGTSSGWPTFHVEDVDTIDLTNSPPPQHLSYRPAQPTPNTVPQVKAERGSYNMQPSTATPRRSAQQPSYNRPVTHTQSRTAPRQKRVHPDHIARIIQTTDPQVLQRLLIDMCQNSPSLCGAITRGLKYDSRFARETILGNSKQPAMTTPRTTPRMTMPQATPRGPPIVKHEPSANNRNIKLEREPYMAPNIKREAYANTTSTKREPLALAEPSSDDDSDSSLRSLNFLPVSVKKQRDPSPNPWDNNDLYALNAPSSSRVQPHGNPSHTPANHAPYKLQPGFSYTATSDDDDSDDAFETPPIRSSQGSRNPTASYGAVAGMKRKSPSEDFSPRTQEFKPRLY